MPMLVGEFYMKAMWLYSLLCEYKSNKNVKKNESDSCGVVRNV